MKSVILSERMRAAVHMVTRGNVVCDVGCDHGFVSIYLVQQGISPRALAMDLREGPLRAAREHIAAFGLDRLIETRLSDGLHKYESGEADTLICAGMGGGLMQRILEEEREKVVSFRELILQPQSELEQFRRFLRESKYGIVDEEILEEEGKFYQIIKAVPGGEREPLGKGMFPEIEEEELCKLEDRYGPVLIRRKTSVFLSFLEREKAVCEEILAALIKQGLGDQRRKERYGQVEALLRDNRLVRTLNRG